MVKLKGEQIEHIKVCDWLNTKTKLKYWHFVQEGKRSYLDASILKAMGMKAGVSDFFLPKSSADSKYKGLWIELKTGDNQPTSSQLKFIEDMKEEGYQGIVLWEHENVITYIKEFYGIET